MRQKLLKFTRFASSLLPHEVTYLINIQRFTDQEKVFILKKIKHNCLHLDHQLPYDERINKRKYSTLKTWIQERLAAIDVDEQLRWMNKVEWEIMTDSLLPEDEKMLLKKIKNFREPVFFFRKFYELAETYRHFLLVRLRYNDHRLVQRFIVKHRAKYQLSKQVDEKLHTATVDIVNQYAGQSVESIQWEKWLEEVFYNEELDGQNRYLALVRLTFVYLNYGDFNRLLPRFELLDNLFKQGIYYSKRILLNYYGNKLLLHSKLKEYDRAAHFGYLSIRGRNNDYLHYLNNLSAVLLRQKRHQEALKVTQQGLAEMKVSQSFFNKIGFIAFYIKSLNANQKCKRAESYADSFLKAYTKEILEYRWHTFFTAYLETLLLQEKYRKIIRTVNRHRLLDLDKKYQSRSSYLPTILCYHAMAEYQELKCSRTKLVQLLVDLQKQQQKDAERYSLFVDVLQQLQPYIPEIIREVL